MTGTNRIELQGITRSDPQSGQSILHSVSASIDPGERIGLVGPSGSGKTSLLRAFAKLDRYDTGNLTLAGSRVEREAVPTYRRQVIYVAQRPAFVVATVRENLELASKLEVADSKPDWNQIESWLIELGKSPELLEQSVESISGGEQQIVSILRAISLGPRVILLDEPTAALDAESVARFERLVQHWHQDDNPRAFVWSSHDQDQVNRMTSRQITMNDGRIDG